MKPIRIVCWVLFLVAFTTAGAKTRKKICQPKPRVVERLIVEVGNPLPDEYREEVIELPLDTICQRLGTTCDSLRVLMEHDLMCLTNGLTMVSFSSEPM